MDVIKALSKQVNEGFSELALRLLGKYGSLKSLNLDQIDFEEVKKVVYQEKKTIFGVLLLSYTTLKIFKFAKNLYKINKSLRNVPVNPGLKLKHFMGILPYHSSDNLERINKFELLGQAGNSLPENQRNGYPRGVTKWYALPYRVVLVDARLET